MPVGVIGVLVAAVLIVVATIFVLVWSSRRSATPLRAAVPPFVEERRQLYARRRSLMSVPLPAVRVGVPLKSHTPAVRASVSPEAPLDTSNHTMQRLEFARWCVQHGILSEFPSDNELVSPPDHYGAPEIADQHDGYAGAV